MKYIISFILAVSILSTKAQSKVSYDLIFDVGTVFSRSNPIIKKDPGYAVYDPNTGMITIVPGTSKPGNEYKNIISPKISLGARANYTLKENFKIYAGLSISYLEAKRKNTMIISGFSFINSYYQFPTTEVFKFYNLDIPFGASFTYNKWTFNAGITPSIIFTTKFSQHKEEPVDPTEIQILPYQPLHPLDPYPSPVNKTKSFISLSISPIYQLSSKLKIGIEYSHGLSKSYHTDDFSLDYYQSMKTSTLGLKILYTLK